jgi:hypothetical protein
MRVVEAEPGLEELRQMPRHLDPGSMTGQQKGGAAPGKGAEAQQRILYGGVAARERRTPQKQGWFRLPAARQAKRTRAERQARRWLRGMLAWGPPLPIGASEIIML